MIDLTLLWVIISMGGLFTVTSLTALVIWFNVYVGCVAGFFATLTMVLFMFATSFKHDVIVRQLSSKNTAGFIIMDKARLVKQEGVRFWKLLKMRDIVPIPSSDSLDITNKGKFFVEATRDENGEYSYIKYCGKDKTFQPLTTKQRLILINQIKKANDRVQKKWLDYLIPTVALGSLAMVIIMGMVMWGDLAAPIKEARQDRLTYATIQTEQMQLLKDIKQGIQTIDVGTSTPSSPAEPPN